MNPGCACGIRRSHLIRLSCCGLCSDSLLPSCFHGLHCSLSFIHRLVGSDDSRLS